MALGRTAPDLLTPYVPRLAIDWLANDPETRHRVVTGTGVFADLSGYTAMTERLAAKGKAGAEETGEILNEIFEALLSSAYDYGASLVKWGGDAVLLMFDGADHAERATRAAWVMQNTIARVGKVTTSRGAVRVRMSIGVHSGDFHFVLAGSRFHDLVVTGPAASATAQMEIIATAGEVVLSDATVALLEPGLASPHVDGSHLLVEPPDAPLLPRHSAVRTAVELGSMFDPMLRDHLMESAGEYEHRTVAVAFLSFSGTDAVLESGGPEALADAVNGVIAAVQNAATEHEAVYLASDLAVDGGKVMLACGVPNTPGDDATRVLSAITRAVATVSPLTLKAGVTQGRVFAGDFGAPFRRTYSLAGDVVNLAARLMSHAEPGEVLAMPDLLERSRTSFSTSPVDPFTAKGKSKLIRAVRVGPPHGAGGSSREELRLVGRDEELAALVNAEAGAVAGHGSVIEIIGPAGIGKSRLVDERQAKAKIRVLRTDGDLYARATPYLPIERLIRQALGVALEADEEAVAAALVAATTARAPELLPWLPLLAITAGTTVPSTPEVDALDAETRAERLRRVASTLLGALLIEPTMVIFNDTHAMDDASVALIKRFCSDVDTRPWSLVVSRRPEGDDGATYPNATAINLAPLTAEAADELAIAASTAPMPAHRRAQLIERSGGNPLFLRALIASVAAGHDPDALPGEVEDVIAAHIDRLPANDRAWLRTAAVLGMRVDPELLDEILDEPVEPSDAVDEFIREDADGTLVFAHHLIQRTAYEALPYKRRRLLHARASYAIERSAGDDVADDAHLLAVHCLYGDRYDAAWQYARMAGRQSQDSYALVEAAENFELALKAGKHIPGLPAREVAAVAEELATIRFALGEAEETERALKLARAKAKGDPQRLARLQLLTARQRHREGRNAEALRWVSRGRALLSEADAQGVRLRAELAEWASLVHHSQGSSRRFRAWAETAASEAARCGDSQREASALSQLAVAKAQAGEVWQPIDMSEAGTWGPAEQANIANRLGAAAFYAGHPEEAERWYTEAEHFAQMAGHEARAAIPAANRAEILVNAGRSEEAIPVLEQAVAVLRGTHSVAYLPFALNLLGRAHFETGNAFVALPLFEEAHALATESGDTEELASSALWLERLRSD